MDDVVKIDVKGFIDACVNDDASVEHICNYIEDSAVECGSAEWWAEYAEDQISSTVDGMVALYKAHGNHCSACGEPTKNLCSGCGVAKYCSTECHKADWHEHRNECKLISLPFRKKKGSSSSRQKGTKRAVSAAVGPSGTGVTALENKVKAQKFLLLVDQLTLNKTKEALLDAQLKNGSLTRQQVDAKKQKLKTSNETTQRKLNKLTNNGQELPRGVAEEMKRIASKKAAKLANFLGTGIKGGFVKFTQGLRGFRRKLAILVAPDDVLTTEAQAEKEKFKGDVKKKIPLQRRR